MFFFSTIGNVATMKFSMKDDIEFMITKQNKAAIKNDANGDQIVLELVLKPKGRCTGVQNFLLHQCRLFALYTTVSTNSILLCTYWCCINAFEI